NAARAAAAELRDAAAALRNQKELADLPARLAHLGDPESMADRMAKWLAAGKSPEQFELPVGKGKDGAGYSITFLRVAPPVPESARDQTRERMRPFYLATTEVSIRAFIDLVEEGSWVDAHALLGTYPGGGRPTARRYGPRAWSA